MRRHDEQRSLAELERVVSDARAAVLAAAEALAEIRERRLYKEAGYKNFEAYLRARWNMSHTRGYQLIDLALVRRHIPAVENEHQARRIAPALRADRQRVTAAFEALVSRSGPERAVNELARSCKHNGFLGPARRPSRVSPPPAQQSQLPASVYVVVGMPLGEAAPDPRVALSEDCALAIRRALERSLAYRKVLIRRCEVVSQAPRLKEVAS